MVPGGAGLGAGAVPGHAGRSSSRAGAAGEMRAGGVGYGGGPTVATGVGVASMAGAGLVGGVPARAGYAVNGGAGVPMQQLTPSPGSSCSGCVRGSDAAAGAGLSGPGGLCCEPDGSSVGVEWVPAPGGPYTATTTYQFVGEGSGNFERQVVSAPYGWRFRRCCLYVTAVLILVPLLLVLASMLVPEVTVDEGTPSPDIVVITTPAPTPRPHTVCPPPPRPCTIYGDPHIESFDLKRADYYTPGEYWLVKSSTVWIQGKYRATEMTNGLAATNEIGLGGPYLKGHKLIIGVNSIMWDGQSIGGGFDDLGFTWENQDPGVRISCDDQGTVMQKGRSGKAFHVVRVHTPLNTNLEINRWREPGEGEYLNAKISMMPQPEQDGHCGNFNDLPEDDARMAVRARIGKNGVAEGDLIFPGPKLPIRPGGRPDLSDCPDEELKAAMTKCKAAENKFFPSHGCLIDACLGHMDPQVKP
mmetsp:Transcript_33213/g.98880  ORF Transcript_33213/g.98880 Transcript_33213/m.98880 type:complete len:471 (-) Transcript_33213:92-1504(-)